MFKLKKTVLLFASFATLLFSIHTYGAVPEKSLRLSFTLRIESAMFTHLKGLFYELTIPNQSVHSVLAFTDRPARKAFLWSPNAYSKFTQSKGKKSFKQNPPNLTLSFYPKRFDGVFEVSSAERKKGEVKLTLRYIVAKVLDNKTPKPIKAIPENYTGTMLMFVDSSQSVPSAFESCMDTTERANLDDYTIFDIFV